MDLPNESELSYLHVTCIWYVIKDSPEVLYSIYSIDLLEVGLVFFCSCSRNGPVINKVYLSSKFPQKDKRINYIKTLW